MKINFEKINANIVKKLSKQADNWRLYRINCSYHKPTKKGGAL